ncbi:MAG: hypothetical protein JJT96_14620 [Opitutales bacterium]|nr:hypothetical protein [Opitutales bacterium]
MAIRRAFEAVWVQSGGAVYFPPGEFLIERMIDLHRNIAGDEVYARRIFASLRNPPLPFAGECHRESWSLNHPEAHAFDQSYCHETLPPSSLHSCPCRRPQRGWFDLF